MLFGECDLLVSSPDLLEVPQTGERGEKGAGYRANRRVVTSPHNNYKQENDQERYELGSNERRRPLEWHSHEAANVYIIGGFILVEKQPCFRVYLAEKAHAGWY